MLKFIKLSIILLLFFNIFSTGILIVNAANPIGPTPSGVPLGTVETEPGGLLPTPHGPSCPADSPNCGNYTLNDMVSVVLVISEFILGIVGSLALLAFVVGGLMWLLSAGKSDLVERGKQTIIGAVVGLAIVFTSYMIIQLVFTALGIPHTDLGDWATSTWFESQKYQ